MAIAEKISIALPPEMVAVLRTAVATGEYASSSEVVRDALRDWTYKRSLRQQGIAELRQVWCEALQDKRPGVSTDDPESVSHIPLAADIAPITAISANAP